MSLPTSSYNQPSVPVTHDFQSAGGEVLLTKPWQPPLDKDGTIEDNLKNENTHKNNLINDDYPKNWDD